MALPAYLHQPKLRSPWLEEVDTSDEGAESFNTRAYRAHMQDDYTATGQPPRVPKLASYSDCSKEQNTYYEKGTVVGSRSLSIESR